jgi:hypothetical protein
MTQSEHPELVVLSAVAVLDLILHIATSSAKDFAWRSEFEDAVSSKRTMSAS